MTQDVVEPVFTAENTSKTKAILLQTMQASIADVEAKEAEELGLALHVIDRQMKDIIDRTETTKRNCEALPKEDAALAQELLLKETEKDQVEAASKARSEKVKELRVLASDEQLDSPLGA